MRTFEKIEKILIFASSQQGDYTFSIFLFFIMMTDAHGVFDLKPIIFAVLCSFLCGRWIIVLAYLKGVLN